ncbi:hypothetical protein ASF83_10460 [Plantibacter sp. Leaf171]|uniref:DUF7882 family protein n=1 Tax=unclassified Plantibacter TaxID=2624265 RepID=UPI0006F32144|nr:MULTISPECIES: hypothetical protein [unclassified Plantibacter]KQM16269.1 hypothetical protein ASE44_10475 [Plantibacter sp. Leaf1]KQQ52371.1 hypothetical protein ASF68_08510 [Plantibacter sp. Leaf314]KQR59402.1 hypothetical protein ASF83_10460 [Plantibacter sp. Leaf171]
MGQLVYGTGDARVRLDDRMLAHVKTIALMKLRRNESFALTVRQDSTTEGRTTLWLHPAIALQFSFDTDEVGEMDRSLLESFMHEANTGEVVVHASSEHDSAARSE